MSKISTLIGEIYHEYATSAKLKNLSIDLDIATDEDIEDPETFVADLNAELNSAIERSLKSGKSPKITISAKDSKIKIKDNGTVLSQTTCDTLSNSRTKVKSRVGFGTTVEIDLSKSPQKSNKQDSSKK